MRDLLRFLLALILVPGLLCAQELSVRARVDSTRFLVGDPIAVHLDVTHPKGASLQIAVGDTIEGFSVLDHPTFSPNGETSSSATLMLAKYDSGAAVLPPLELLCSLPGDTTLHRASTNPLIFTIQTLQVDTSQAFKDLKPLLSIPFTLAEIALYVGIILAVVALSYFGYKYWKKRQQKVTGTVYVPPPRPAHIIALEELAILKEKHLWQQGLIKEYYSGVSEIIRRYIENRFALMALEQTTDEIMHGLKRAKLKSAVSDKIETLLQLADLVKFAKYQPGISEHEGLFGIASEIVDATKVVETKSVVQEEHKAANVES